MRQRSRSITTAMRRHGEGALANLPLELLAQIVAHLETARALSNFSQTCARIRNFIEQDGFRVFVQKRFPYVQAPPVHPPSFWRGAAHGLTTLERNWERRSFIAWSINPRAEDNQEHRRQRSYFRSGQTMGFVPVIDSYEMWYGGDWSSRKEVVAWSTGAGLVMRIKIMGSKATDMWEAAPSKALKDFNVHQHRINWANYHETEALEGRDDITSVNMLPSQSLVDPEQVLIGRASGDLSLISLATDTANTAVQILSSFKTAGRPVRSATTNASGNHLLAACLSDSCVAFYPLEISQSYIKPIEEFSILTAGCPGRTWSSRFLNYDRLAVGLGPSKEPIQIYDIRQISDRSVRSLALSDGNSNASVDLGSTDSTATSVYSLAAVATSSSAGGFDGGVFLSGAYDGLTRYVSHRLSSDNLN